MLLSVAIGALPWYPLRSTLALARDAGADGVEVMLSPRSATTSGAALADRAAATGIPVLSIHAVLRYRRVTLRRKIEDDRASIRFAGSVAGCRALVLHPPLTGPGPSPELNRWLAAITAERLQVNPKLRLAIENRAENWDGVGPQHLDDLQRMRALAGEWDLDITLDLAHAASFGIDLIDALDTVAPRLINVHLSDVLDRRLRGGVRNGLFRDHRIPGSGRLPIAEVLARLRGNEYQGLVTLELSPVSLRAWWPTSARRLLREAVSDVCDAVPPEQGLSTGVGSQRNIR
jgi:sugar phosphate isomerase/epimerase